MAIKATGRATFTAVEDYDVVFVLNGIRCDVLNFDSVRTAESAVLEADFFNGGTSCVVDKAVLCCYDGESSLLGSPIEVHDASSAVADGGSLYLSKDCKTITCDIYAGGKKLCGKSLPVIRDGSSVGVKAVSYKVINNVASNASLNWDSVTSQTAYPTQKPDKGKYCYVMTIVLYTDGTTTNTISTSYTPNDGTSVKVTSTKVEYAGSDNGTTAPTSGWQTSVPQLAQGKYLWTRTTVAYSDGNSTISYSVGRIGMDGSKGGTTHILYASSASPKSAADVRTTIDAGHQYYGTYQDTNVDDDVNKYTSVKSWVLIKGDTPPMYSLEAVSGNNDAGNDTHISYNGQKIAGSISRGQTVYFLRGGTAPSVVYSKSYDTYGNHALATDLATFLLSSESAAYDDCVLVIIGFDALTVNDDLRNALKSYGYGGDNLLYNVSDSRTSFAFIGQKGMTEGTAYYKMSKNSKVSLTASVSNGVLVGTGHKGDKGGKGDPGVSYRLVPMSDRSATVRASNSSTSATFSLVYTLHYKAEKRVGDSSEAAKIATISATIEGKTVTTTVNNTEGALSGTGSKSYTSTDRPANSIPVTVTLSDGTVLYDNVPVTMEAGVAVDINQSLATVTQTLANQQGDINTIRNTANSNSATISSHDGRLSRAEQTAGNISLKVQDLQNGSMDTSKPHTSSQVDFRTLDSNSFYPVMIRLKEDGGVRHTVEIKRPLDGTYGSGKSYMNNGRGFSFRLVFSDVANAWGSREDGQLRIESISQRWTAPTDTPICPKIAQYYPFSFMLAWLRGGSKYDITVDCTDACISGIWPYMMQVASDPSWVSEVVSLSSNTWTTEQVNAQGGNPYNLLKHDSGGFYADTENEFLYRFGSMTAGNTFAIVGQPTDSKQWFMATWHITSVSGSKVYVDVSTYGILWQTQNPLGIRMNGVLGYIKNGVSYAKSTWDSQSGFGTSENVDNTAVHANWVTPRSILVIGKESSATNGVYRDRAVLESVQSCEDESSVYFYNGTFFDVSPLYGTDGRKNVKPDLLATGIDIESKTVKMTGQQFVWQNNAGVKVAYMDDNGNATFSGVINATGGNFTGTVTGATIVGSTLQSSDGTNTTTIKGGNITTNSISATGGSIGAWTIKDGGLSAAYGSDAKISLYSSSSFFELDSNMNSGGGYLLRMRNDNGGVIDLQCYADNKTALSILSNGANTLAISALGNSNILSRIGEGTVINRLAYACARVSDTNVYFDRIFLTRETGDYKIPGNMIVTTNQTTDQTIWLPKRPVLGVSLLVIQGTNRQVNFNGNGHSFQQGSDVNSSANSNQNGQWNLFIFDGQYWQCIYITGHLLW